MSSSLDIEDKSVLSGVSLDIFSPPNLNEFMGKTT